MSDAARNLWMARPGRPFALHEQDAGSTAHAPGDRAATEEATLPLHGELAGLQDRLWAEARRSVLVVLQGIDAAGKDGTISHVFRGLNPQGTTVAAFKTPTALELEHDFLWRVHARCPRAGEIAIFNRSHYEDVLIARVHQLVPETVWRKRYDHINAFERLLSQSGTRLVKIFLHISAGEQAERLAQRRRDPTKQWKVSDADLAERSYWGDYAQAFQAMVEETSTPDAPWYVVPSDHKWYRNWVVSTILIEVLKDMDPVYPPPAAGAIGP